MCCRPSSRLFFPGFGNLPRAGEVLPKFSTYSVVFFCFAEQDLSRGLMATRVRNTRGSGWQVSPYGQPSTQHTWPGAHPQHGHPGLSGSPPPRPRYSYPYQSVTE